MITNAEINTRDIENNGFWNVLYKQNKVLVRFASPSHIMIRIDFSAFPH